MKTYEIDYKAPVAVLKKSLVDRYPTASVYKVKRYASFVIRFPHNSDIIYCGDPDQVVSYALKNGLNLIPKNARGRKFFVYTIVK